MASYKLIQDIEADDKLLGPLSFRQFIYALIGTFMLYISYLLFAHHAGILTVITLPIALAAGFLAYPFGKDQPTEVWAVAKLRFLIKPRRRIWAQSGIKELVTITVPKAIEVLRTDGLTQSEVRSRLQALANTIDSRGWAIKNVSDTYINPMTIGKDSDRLISAASLPRDVPDDSPSSRDDLFDEATNPIAQQVSQMLNATTSLHRQQIIEHLNEIRADAAQQNQTVSVSSPAQDTQVDQQLKTAYAAGHTPLNNMHTLRTAVPAQPSISQTKGSISLASTDNVAPPQTTSTSATDPVIMNLSQRNDLKVSVISHEADRALGKNDNPDEVLISLH